MNPRAKASFPTMRRSAWKAAACVAGLMIAGCAVVPQQPAPSSAPSSAPAPEPAAPQSQAPGAQQPANTPTPTATPRPALPPQPLANPDELAGLSGDAVQQKLGAPDFARADPPGALWQYRGDGCLLDIYLYAADHNYHVRYFRFRAAAAAKDNTNGGSPDPRACYTALLHANAESADQ